MVWPALIGSPKLEKEELDIDKSKSGEQHNTGWISFTGFPKSKIERTLKLVLFWVFFIEVIKIDKELDAGAGNKKVLFYEGKRHRTWMIWTKLNVRNQWEKRVFTEFGPVSLQNWTLLHETDFRCFTEFYRVPETEATTKLEHLRKLNARNEREDGIVTELLSRTPPPPSQKNRKKKPLDTNGFNTVSVKNSLKGRWSRLIDGRAQSVR